MCRWRAKGERLMGKGGFKNKELRVWQNGKDLAVYVYQISQKKLLFKEIEKGCIEISSMLSNSKLISARSKTFCP